VKLGTIFSNRNRKAVDMYHCVIATSRYLDFEDFMTQPGKTEVIREESGTIVMKHIASVKTDLLVVDEKLKDMDGIELVRKSIMINPSVNTVVVSDLSVKNFHEASEGLGVLLQVPEHPARHHGEEVMKLLEKIHFRLKELDSAGEREVR
jgi:DNA-binding NarL/FixJ family response regulator